MKKVIQGYVGEYYSNCWFFETNETAYSSKVVRAIDELLGTYTTKDGDEIRITIEHLGNVHDKKGEQII